MVIKNFFDIGGSEINTRHLVENMQELGQDVQVISMWKPYKLDEKIKVHGIHYKGKTPPFLPRYSYNFILMVYMFIQTIVVALREKIDLFHVHMVLPTGFPVIFACRLLRKPVVVSARGSDLNVFSNKFIFKPFAKFTLQKADAVIALSRGLGKKALLLGAQKNRIFVIPNGVDTTIFFERDRNLCRSQFNVKMDDKIVLFVGTIKSYRRKIKGLEHLLSVMKTVIARVPTAKLMVVGVHSLPDLEDIVFKLGIKENVLFLGVIPYEHIPLYYCACDVFVLPSIMEGLPTTVLEAMASAKPVVAWDIEGCRDLIEDGVNGFLVSPSDSDALAEKIIQVITKEELAFKLGKEARKITETQYTWESVTQETITLYNATLKNQILKKMIHSRFVKNVLLPISHF